MSSLAWRFNNKYGVAYLEDRGLVDEILKLEGSRLKLNDGVMATYLSPGGKPFAWQIAFSMNNWEHISRILGVEEFEKAVRVTLPRVQSKSQRKQTKAKRKA